MVILKTYLKPPLKMNFIHNFLEKNQHSIVKKQLHYHFEFCLEIIENTLYDNPYQHE